MALHARRLPSLLATLAAALAGAVTLARPAAGAGEACAGSGAAPCPYVSASLVGQRAEGVVRFPEAVALDPNGYVYVADQLSYVVQKWTAQGTFVNEWGSYGGGHGQFGPIAGLAVDAAGNVYVVDSSHNRIEKFDSSGRYLMSWGHKGSALGDFSFGSSQDYTKPPGGGIAVAGEYVYVADSGNNRIERFNLEGQFPIQFGSGGDAPGQMRYPRAVAANGAEVVVSDDDHRVQVFDPNGGYIGQTGSAGSGPGQFGFTYGVAIDAAGNIYVADDLGHRVVKLGRQLQFLGAWGGFGSKPGQLAFPRALASDPAGDTYVADTANDRIEVFDPNGAFLRTLGISGRGVGELTAPRGLAIDPAGRLLAADTDGNRVEVYAPSGEDLIEQWTLSGGSRSSLFYPAGIAVDPAGAVYVSDNQGTRVVRYWGDGTYLGEIGGPAQAGGAQLTGARSVAVAPATHELWVADTGHNRVLLYGPEGSLLRRIGAGEGNGAAGGGLGAFNRPAAVATNAAGDAYVADTANDRIVVIAPAGEVIGQWGVRGGGDGRLRGPNGVAVDAAGTVYVLDGENNRVQAFTPSGSLVSKWGLRGTGLGEFSQPGAIAVGCDGEVYVADTNNNRIERFQPVSPAGTGCLALSAWPPPLDVPPVLSVALPRSVGVLARRGLALSVACQRGCRILVTGMLTPRRGRGAVRLRSSGRALPKGLAGHVRLSLSARGLGRLKRSLGHRRLLTARVRIVAVGPTGRRVTVSRVYTVAR